jgi:hypothetical protein
LANVFEVLRAQWFLILILLLLVLLGWCGIFFTDEYNNSTSLDATVSAIMEWRFTVVELEEEGQCWNTRRRRRRRRWWWRRRIGWCSSKSELEQWQSHRFR